MRNFNLTVEEREDAQNALAYLNSHWVASLDDFLSDRTLEMVLGTGWEDDPEAIFELFIDMTRIAQISGSYSRRGNGREWRRNDGRIGQDSRPGAV